jgi:hypothetical protein
LAITSIDLAIAGARPVVAWYKASTTPEAAGLPFTYWYALGYPGPGSAVSVGLAGASMSSPVTGAFEFSNPSTTGWESRLMAFTATHTGVGGTVLLCDRLWANSGLNATSTATQTINSAAFAARDGNGTTLGFQVMVACEWSGAGGAGTPATAITYTNSDGVAGRVSSVAFATTNNQGTLYIYPLQGGDKGVRSVQAFFANATSTSGSPILVAFRVLAQVPINAVGFTGAVDLVTGGNVKLYDGSVLFPVFIPAAATAGALTGTLVVTQG